MKIDDTTWRQWVDLELEGELEAPERARLDELLETDDRVADERRVLGSLHRMIDNGRIPVRSGFLARVMAALPEAWWQRRAAAGLPRWALPLAAMLISALGAALLLASAEDTGIFTGIGATLVDFIQVTVLAGAGMLFATWRGFGFGLQEMIANSGLSLAAIAVAVGFLNLLFVSMLRRRPRTAASTVDSAESPGRR